MKQMLTFLSKFCIYFLTFNSSSSFILPNPILGRWTPHKHSTNSFFYIDSNQIYAIQDNANVSMSIKNFTMIEPMKFHITFINPQFNNKFIPKSFNPFHINQFFKFYNSVSNYGLECNILIISKDTLEIHWKTHHQKGNLFLYNIYPHSARGSSPP
jgi:hypothetical protein